MNEKTKKGSETNVCVFLLEFVFAAKFRGGRHLFNFKLSSFTFSFSAETIVFGFSLKGKGRIFTLRGLANVFNLIP